MPEPPNHGCNAATGVRTALGSLTLAACVFVLAPLNLYVLGEVSDSRDTLGPTGPWGALLFAAASIVVLASIWIVTFRPRPGHARFQFSLRTALAVSLTLGLWMTLNARPTDVRGSEQEVRLWQNAFQSSSTWNWTAETRILAITHRYRGWPLQWDWMVYEIDKPADGKTTTLSIPTDPEDPEFYQLGNLFVCAAMLISAFWLSRRVGGRPDGV